MFPFDDQVQELLELYSLEEALDVIGVTPAEAINILLSNGYAELPPFLQETDEDEEQSTS